MAMKAVKIESDPQTGSTYVYFENIGPGEAVEQVVFPGGMILDLAKDGRILGIEIL